MTQTLLKTEKTAIVPTDEQLAIHQSKAKTLIVEAFAGAGKTSSFIGFAEAFPSTRMLYLAFSAAVKDEAKTKFPKNVRCVTGHGLAYRDYGLQYAHKLNNPKPFHLMQPLALDAKSANIVLQTVNNFLQSGEMEIMGRHAAFAAGGDQAVLNNIVRLARQAWELMKDIKNVDVPMPHDGYLKLFHLAGEVIHEEVIMLDEAQDSNGVLLAIVMASPGRKIFVGDRHQAIFGFRGAVNAMDKIEADEHLYLTASFRFGAGIANLANAVIGQYSLHTKPIRGLGKHATKFNVDLAKPHTRIARTNAILFAESIRVLNSGRSFGFLGGVENYKFDSVLDAYNLSAGNKGFIKDQLIKSFPDFANMRVYAESTDDKELKSIINVVEDYGSDIPRLVKNVQEGALKDLSLASIIMTTAHKSKGLEWDSVYLCNDFTDMMEKVTDGVSKKPDIEEVNLLYVALTRAERCISLPESLDKFLEEVRMFDAISDRPKLESVKKYDNHHESKAKSEPKKESFAAQMAHKVLDVVQNSTERTAEMNKVARELIHDSEGMRKLILSSPMSMDNIKKMLDYVNTTEFVLKKAIGQQK